MKLLLNAVLLVCLGAAAAFAQTTATLTGNIKDDQGVSPQTAGFGAASGAWPSRNAQLQLRFQF